MPAPIQQRGSISVTDTLDVAVGRTALRRTISFVGQSRIDARRIFGFVLVEDRIAFVIAALADKPGENAVGIFRVRNTRILIPAVQGKDVVPGDGTPVHIPIPLPGPALDAGEEAFCARSIAVHRECLVTHRAGLLETAAVRIDNRNQVFSAGKDEDIRLFRVSILRKALVGFAGDGGERQVPAQAKRPVASSRIVGERKLRPETGASRADGNGRAHGTTASDRVGRKLLAHAANGASTFGERNRRSRQSILFISGLGCLFGKSHKPSPSLLVGGQCFLLPCGK